MAARKAQQNGVKRERLKFDAAELRKVKILNLAELQQAVGKTAAALFAKKVAEFAISGKRRTISIPKSLRDRATFPEFTFEVRYEYGGNVGTVTVWSLGKPYAYVGEQGTSDSVFADMLTEGFLVPLKK
jgi:hypothetical protein